MAIIQTPHHIIGGFRRKLVFFSFFCFYWRTRFTERLRRSVHNRAGEYLCTFIGARNRSVHSADPPSPSLHFTLHSRPVAVSRRQSINLASCVRKQFRLESSRLPPPPQRCRISSASKRKPTVAGLYRVHVTADGVRYRNRTPMDPTTYHNMSS